MPRFYFDFRDDDGALVLDDEGIILPSIAEAKIEASIALAAHGAEALPGTEPRKISVQIRLAETIVGEVVIAIEFRSRQRGLR